MKTIARLLTLFAVLVFAGAAQAQTSLGRYSKTLSTTGRTLLYTNSTNKPLYFSGSYYTTGTPTSVSITIETGNVLAGTSAPFTKISALTNTTSAQFEEVTGGTSYWYANLGTLSGGSSPTVIVTYTLSEVVAINNRQSSDLATTGVTFEGATADDFDTLLSITDPTADRTITFPDASGTVALSAAAQGSATGVVFVANGIEAEGATADGFETTITFTDPTTPDKTITVPDATGTVMLSSLATNGADVANAVTGASNALVFEGATADGFETTITVIDPTTPDKVFTLPNDTGTALISTLSTNSTTAANSVSAASNALVFEGATADAFELSLAPTDVGADVTATLPGGANAAYALLLSSLTTNDLDAANSIWATSNSLVFEGLTADANETTFTPTDPTADQTITIPNFAVNWAMLGSTLTTNTIDAANSIWATSNNLAMEGATADAFEVFITPTDPAIDTTVTIPAIASGAYTLGQVEVTFHDQVAGDATDRTFFVATKGYIVNACSEVHSVAAGGISTLQVTKETTTGAPGTGTDLLTTAYDLNGTANTVTATVAAGFVSLAARTMATGDRLSVDYANAIQSSAGVMVTCSLLPN